MSGIEFFTPKNCLVYLRCRVYAQVSVLSQGMLDIHMYKPGNRVLQDRVLYLGLVNQKGNVYLFESLNQFHIHYLEEFQPPNSCIMTHQSKEPHRTLFTVTPFSLYSA